MIHALIYSYSLVPMLSVRLFFGQAMGIRKLHHHVREGLHDVAMILVK